MTSSPGERPDAAMVPFQFSSENLTRAKELMDRYPDPRAATLPVLWLAQQQISSAATGPRHLTKEVIRVVAQVLGLPPATVWGVASFYTMFHTRPVGRRLIEVCTSVSCSLVGGEELFGHICRRLGLDPDKGGTTSDGNFTVRRAECLAACGYAPMLQLDEGSYFERLTAQDVDRLLAEWSKEDNGPGVKVDEVVAVASQPSECGGQ